MSCRASVCGTLVLVCICIVSARGQEKSKVEIEKGVVYARIGDREMQLDLARPTESDGPFPAVVCLHGGGWRAGDRNNMAQTIQVLAGRGYVAITPSYRFAPKDAFPAQVEDCKAAVRWLRANAKTYKLNPERIGVVGLSAGGHLACMLGLTKPEDGLEGKGGNGQESSKVQAVVSFFGPTDFTRKTWTKNIEDGVLKPFLGGTLEEKGNAYKKASPATYVHKEAPPVLLFHGTKDAIVDVEQSRLLAEKLKAAGANARLVELEGEGHAWGGEKLVQSVAEMVKFFDEHLKK